MSIFVVTCSLHDNGRRESLCRTIEETYVNRREREQHVLPLAHSNFAIKSLQTASRITQVLKEPIAASHGDWLMTREMTCDEADCFGAASPEEWFDLSCFKERLVENAVNKMLCGPSDTWNRKQVLRSVREVANEYVWSG